MPPFSCCEEISLSPSLPPSLSLSLPPSLPPSLSLSRSRSQGWRMRCSRTRQRWCAHVQLAPTALETLHTLRLLSSSMPSTTPTPTLLQALLRGELSAGLPPPRVFFKPPHTVCVCTRACVRAFQRLHFSCHRRALLLYFPPLRLSACLHTLHTLHTLHKHLFVFLRRERGVLPAFDLQHFLKGLAAAS